MAHRQHDRRTRHIAVELQKGDHRTGEGDRTNGDAQAQFDTADGQDFSRVIQNAKGPGIEIGGNPDQHRGHADQRVKAGDQLRHVSHRDLARHDEAETAADGNRNGNFGQAGNAVRDQGGDHGDQHADHAEPVAASARFRRRQTAQRQNEQHACHQIGRSHPGIHRLAGGGECR